MGFVDATLVGGEVDAREDEDEEGFPIDVDDEATAFVDEENKEDIGALPFTSGFLGGDVLGIDDDDPFLLLVRVGVVGEDEEEPVAGEVDVLPVGDGTVCTRGDKYKSRVNDLNIKVS